MEKFKALCSKGDKAFKHDQLFQAVTYYSDALSLSPGNTDILGCRSVVCAKLGMFNESKKDAESLISILPRKPKGHFLRAVALESLGNYTECLESYLRAYELDSRHPTELLLSVVQVVGCICQMSESEELTLYEDGACQKFEKFVQLGKRLCETGNYKICIGLITTALRAHYQWDDKLLQSEATVENMRGKSFVQSTEKDDMFYHTTEELQSSLPTQNFGFSSIYLATGNQEDENDRDSTEESKISLQNCRAVMSGLLIIGESHYCLYQYIVALSVAKQCLSIALDLKDKEYEIKSYIKLANIYQRLGQYIQAVSYNAKLLAVGRDLESRSSEEERALYKDLWNSDVERKAVWNLSAVYKLMGDYKKALEHAQEYMDVLKYIDQENLTEAYSNLGELQLLLGNNGKALECHKIELQLCKKFNDLQGMAYAYGNIGVVFATMGSFNSATVYHEQHLTLAQSLKDKISELMALKNFGCMYKLMGEQTKALGFFEQHLQLAKVNKLNELQCKAYHLIGSCYWSLNQLHHAQYYYELCLKLAEEHSYPEETLESRLALAQITKSMRQFEMSRQFFNKVIPILEEKLLLKHGRSLIYQDPLLEKLEECCEELQEALAEMNCPEEALEIAEHCKSRIFMNILRHQNILVNAESSALSPSSSSLLPCSVKDILYLVDSQNAVVLFYSMIPSGFLLWFISPGNGIIKFYWNKLCSHVKLTEQIELCLEELHSSCKNSYECDHRALPEKATFTKEQRPSDQGKSQNCCSACEFLYSSKLTALQKLYHLLLFPMEDELGATDIKELIIVPDAVVNSVPFTCLQDPSGKYLFEFFHVRILSCIRAISLQAKDSPASTISAEKPVNDSKILVIGSPKIPNVSLNGKIWSPKNRSDLGDEEMTTIASLLGVDPVAGRQATKDYFLKTLPQASVVHLVTYGSWSDASVALYPNRHHEDNLPSEEAYLVTMSDIASMDLSAKLFVLNACCGCGHQFCHLKHANFHFATALVAAGVKSVVMPLWSVAQDSMINWLYQFYASVEKGKTVGESLKEALDQIKSVAHVSSPDFWASYVHFGFDTTVDLMKLRHDLCGKTLDMVVRSCTPKRFPLVTTEILDSKVPPVTAKLKTFQELLTILLLQHGSFTHVLPALKYVVQLAHQMLLSYHHPELLLSEDLMMCAQLSSQVLEAPFARDLLTFLGFDLQKDGARDKDPFVVFPHWDPDGTLSMAYQVLKAICDILTVSSHRGYVLAKIAKTLTKNTMEKLKGLLTLSRHYPERILKTSDFVLHSLWFNPELQRFLASLGFYEVGQSLLFNKTENNQTLLRCTLCIVSVMLDYIEKGRVQTASVTRESRCSDGRPIKLTSLSPQLTPSKQIVMGTPWMSKRVDNSENGLKVALARQLEGINKEFAGHVTRSNYWHAQLLRAQSFPGNSLPVIGNKDRKKPTDTNSSAQKAGKVKVHGGLTPSCNRRLVEEEEPRLSINATRQRRNEIYRIYAKRFDDIAMRKRQEVRKVFMSQIGDHS